MEFPLTARNAIIHGTVLPECPRPMRRRAETEATARLAEAVFGPGTEISHDIHGAPFIAGRPENISISHGAGIAVMAVSHKAVGIDIECLRPSLRRTASKFLSEEELAVYGASDMMLLRAWTAKEALFKAIGNPQLTVSLITLPSDPDAGTVSMAGHTYTLTRFCEADTVITLAVAE